MLDFILHLLALVLSFSYLFSCKCPILDTIYQDCKIMTANHRTDNILMIKRKRKNDKTMFSSFLHHGNHYRNHNIRD